MNQDLLVDLSDVMTLAVDTGLFVSLCTIQRPVTTLGPTGTRSGAYSDVTGLVDIQCMDAPENLGTGFSVSQLRQPTDIDSKALRHVLLDDFYPDLSPETNWGNVGWRAVVDGVAYNIKGAECDSQRIMTRLSLQAVTI